MFKSLHMATTFLALDKVGCIVFSSLFGWGLVPYGYWILPSLFSELHAVQLHCWRKCQLNNKLTPPCDVPLSCMGMPYLQTEHCTPSPVAQWKSLFFHNTLLLHRDSLLKGAFKWPKFSLTISAHRYYTETPHEFNILTSFLNRIWVQLSESFSELQIGWFLWHLDQKIILIL